MHIELPSIVNTQMAEEEFRKAVQQNFDHIIGSVRDTTDILDALVGGPAGNPQALEEAVNNMDLEARDPAVYEVLNESGVGAEDGLPPQSAPVNIRAVGGIGNWFLVRADGVANTSGVGYEIHVSTSIGFTPAANTRVDTVLIPGGDANVVSYIVRDFPTGHLLDGTGADPVNATTTYYVKIVPTDGDGAGPASAEVSTSAMKVDASSVLAAGTIVAGLIGAGEVVAEKISSINLTTLQAAVGTLSALTANVGTLTAGTIRGVTFESASGGNYVKMASGLNQVIEWYVSSGLRGVISADTDGLTLAHAGDVLAPPLKIQSGKVFIAGTAKLEVEGTLWVGTDADTPPAGKLGIRKSGNDVVFFDNAGRTASLTMV